MESNARSSSSSAAELLLQVLWVVGAIAAYFVGSAFHALAGIGVLALLFAFCLLLARASRGWAAIPGMCAALLLQAPLLVGLGYYNATLRPIGDNNPYLCFFWRGTDWQLVASIALIVALSSPVGALLRIDRRAVDALRWFARGAAPVATLALIALVALSALRLARLPTPDRYIDSLPLQAALPKPEGQPCTPLDVRKDPAHDSGWQPSSTCATPELEAGPLRLHYHRDEYREDYSSYALLSRSASGHEHPVLWLGSSPSEVKVKRDDALGLYFLIYEDATPRALGVEGHRRWVVSMEMLASRIAPPLGWVLLAAAGLLVALGCFGASFALAGVEARTDGRRAWLAARRGDLALVSLTAALLAGALLTAALVTGLLL